MVFLLYTRAGKSKMFKRVFQLFKIARKLASSGAIDTINEILSETPVSLDIFPDLPNPFRQSIIPNLGSTPVGQLPPVVSGATPSVVNANARFGSIPTIAGQTDPEEFNKVFPNG